MTFTLGDTRLPERFWAKIELSDDGCWLATRGLNGHGYGQISINSTVWYTHRLAYAKFIGTPPEGMYIDHLCRNRACCNPVHLEAVTNRENVLRGNAPSARFARATHCIHGHEFTEDNLLKSKLPHRVCLTCSRGWWAQAHARRKAKREATKLTTS